MGPGDYRPAYAAGGYASGPIMTGEQGREFVIRADTTRELERYLGPLSNEKLQGALGGGSFSIDHHITLDGDGAQYVPEGQLVELIRDTVGGDIREFVKAVKQ